MPYASMPLCLHVFMPLALTFLPPRGSASIAGLDGPIWTAQGMFPDITRIDPRCIQMHKICKCYSNYDADAAADVVLHQRRAQELKLS